MSDLVFRVIGDDSQVPAAVARTTTQLGKLPGTTRAAATSFDHLTRNGKLTAQGMQQLSFQTQDFFVQVASGQSALTALIQQGSQLTGTFGGVGGALRALGSLFTLTNLAIGAGVAAVGGLGYAYLQAQERQSNFQRYLVLTGNAAGVTADEVDAMARRIADSTKVSIGAARELVTAYADTGKVGPAALESVARATARLAQASGKDAADVRKEFDGLFDKPAASALKLNERYNFLTADTAKLIVKLQEQGKVEEAGKLVADELNKSLEARSKSLNIQIGLWQRFTNWVSKANMALGNMMAAPDTKAQTKAVLERIEAEKEAMAFAQERGRTTEVEGRRRAIEALTKQYHALFDVQIAEGKAASGAEQAKAERGAVAGILGAADNKPKPGRAAKDLGDPFNDAQDKLEAQLRERFDKIADSEDAAREKAIAADIDAYRKRSEAGAQFGAQIAEQTDAMNIGLIGDIEARGQAIIALEKAQMTARLDALDLEGDEYTRIWNEIQGYVAARNAQLTEELKPEWRRQLAAWRDTNALMRDSFNDFQSGWLREGEDAWLRFAQTGKLSTKSLVDFMVAELARLQFRQQLSGGWSSIGQAIGNFLRGSGGGFGTGSGYGNQDLGQYFASGGAFAGGVHAFAKGGIMGANGGMLTRPTVFPMKNGGIGLGGEAGTEAVMPLARTSNGKLGVMAQGGGASQIVLEPRIINQASGTVEATTQQGADGQLEVIIRRVEAQIGANVAANRGPVARGMRARGVDLSGGLPRVG